MPSAYYSNSIAKFCTSPPEEIMGLLTENHDFTLLPAQRDAWLEEIQILQTTLPSFNGSVFLEYSIPRMGKRIDAVLLIGPVVFILEFKVGEREFRSQAIDQVWDYSLDLKNFHEPSHPLHIAPILIATRARGELVKINLSKHEDKVLQPSISNAEKLGVVLHEVLAAIPGPEIEPEEWENGRYCPTPTIIEAATALYHNHSVADIARNDASAINLSITSETVSEIIRVSKDNSYKSICFVTGVPGAGKTLVGLNIATKHFDKENELYSVFLSGNGPLVKILCEALARDEVHRAKERKEKLTLNVARTRAKSFIQNVHHFRDEYLRDLTPPVEHVALFDEAQRAWDVEQAANFMRRRRRNPNFNQSEPEFLISCMDRHRDWAVIVCLVGGGQEINTGEAGIGEWIKALLKNNPQWHIYLSSRLMDSEYGAGEVLQRLEGRERVEYKDELHLSVSMRSFRAEHVSLLVKEILDLKPGEARVSLGKVREKYPIVITRDIQKAKRWLKEKARGTERYGMVASSQAERLRPHAINVKSPMDPIHWFLDGKEDVRSSFYLEDVATEFHIQGLELDWTCVTWDADFKYSQNGWDHKSFCGDRWKNIKKAERKTYLKNAYRVLLTRARQGMVIVVPRGDTEDHTRQSEFYDPTYDYLKAIGFNEI